MKYTILLFSIIIVIGLSFSINRAQGQQPDNLKPMYGEVAKNEEYQAIDQRFINECIQQFGTKDSAVTRYTNQAWRYFYNNDMATAMKRFNQVWLLNPEFPDAYFGFAALSEMKGYQAEADRLYQLGIKKDIRQLRAPICYQRIADCKEQLKDTNGTLNAYIKLSEISPDNAFSFKKIGYFQMKLGNNEQALKAYSKAIELDPKDAVTFSNRASLYQSAKDYQKAIADYTKAIQLDAKYISAYANRGITYMETKNYKDAKKDFETCVHLDPNEGELRRFLGLAELDLKEQSEACKNLNLAAKLGDTVAEQLIAEHCK
jgi:tetratricopeptide (TPR) repeat protein